MAYRVQKLGPLPFSGGIVVSAALSTPRALTMHIRISARTRFMMTDRPYPGCSAGRTAPLAWPQRKQLSGADALIFAHGRARFGFV